MSPMQLFSTIKAVTNIKVISNVRVAGQAGEDLTRKLVYAGLGVCRVGLEQVNGVQSRVNQQFSAMVAQGESVESELRDRVQDTRQAVRNQAEAQFNQVLNRTCGIDRRRLTEFEDKVDRLQAAVEKLADKRGH